MELLADDMEMSKHRSVDYVRRHYCDKYFDNNCAFVSYNKDKQNKTKSIFRVCNFSWLLICHLHFPSNHIGDIIYKVVFLY